MMPKVSENTVASRGMVAPPRYTATKSHLADKEFLPIEMAREWAFRYCQLNDHPEGAL